MDRRIGIAAGFVLPLMVLGGWSYALIGAADVRPGYVVRIPLPDGAVALGLPPVEGPDDASRPLVVIDAGHGGHDPGASGEGTLREKVVTLALAQALREALLADGRMRVAMTRNTDRFLVLEERSGIARRLGADLFVSIHADAADAHEASGATVYTLSDRGSDAVADQVAKRENSADAVNGVALGGRSDAVASILVDLSRREMRERSRQLSDLILRESEGAVPFHGNPQREAAFVVLKSLDLPSVLVEAGYISSPTDAARLSDPSWRKAFTARLAKAIEIFLARRDPGGATP